MGLAWDERGTVLTALVGQSDPGRVQLELIPPAPALACNPVAHLFCVGTIPCERDSQLADDVAGLPVGRIPNPALVDGPARTYGLLGQDEQCVEGLQPNCLGGAVYQHPLGVQKKLEADWRNGRGHRFVDLRLQSQPAVDKIDRVGDPHQDQVRDILKAKTNACRGLRSQKDDRVAFRRGAQRRHQREMLDHAATERQEDAPTWPLSSPPDVGKWLANRARVSPEAFHGKPAFIDREAPEVLKIQQRVARGVQRAGGEKLLADLDKRTCVDLAVAVGADRPFLRGGVLFQHAGGEQLVKGRPVVRLRGGAPETGDAAARTQPQQQIDQRCGHDRIRCGAGAP